MPEPGNQPAASSSPTLALFAQWEMEDSVTGKDDLARREREGNALLETLRDSRLALCVPALSDREDAA